MPDRRLDPEMRTRLSAIQDGYLRISRRVLAAHIFQAVVLVLTVAAFGYLVDQNRENGAQTRDIVDRIQTERIRNTVIACERRNSDHRAIREFITSSVPPAQRDDPRVQDYLTRARDSFPVVDCAVQAGKQVRP